MSSAPSIIPPTSIYTTPQQHIPTNSSSIIQHQPVILGAVSSPNTGIIPHLLQNPINVSAPRQQQQRPQILPTSCSLPVSSIGGSPVSLPNTPLTPVMHAPDHMQIMRQNAMMMQQHLTMQQQQHQQHLVSEY